MDIDKARWYLADFGNRTMDSDFREAAKTVLEENKRLDREIQIKNAYLDLLTFIACDYDGYESPKDLKKLIDGLVSYAEKACRCETDTVEFIGADGKDYNILYEEIEGNKHEKIL